FSAIEARVLAWLAGEKWVSEVFEKGGDIYCETASRMFHCKVEKHGENADLRQKGKQAVLSCGYGGSSGALKAMGALEAGMTEDELQPLVDSWREANPNIVQLWWAVDRAVKECIKKRMPTETHGIRFDYQSGMMFATLPSGRRLAYVKPRIGENRFGGESVTYMGVGGTKKWERLESYGAKFVENLVQGIARDILCYAMQTLKNCAIVGHVHDEVIIEADQRMSVEAVCEQMGRTPPWAKGLLLRADGYQCEWYQKD
ncbi:MAG: DNA polymerase, partial [Dysosmobacter sp.]|nr:DNA polymerase [Dysosmobacter sp.]